MRSEWKKVKLRDVVEFNPRETLSKGTINKKIAMEQLQPFTKTINGYIEAPYNGGSKFRNNDTIMARITPCLENGKTAQINILGDDEIGFGSTEFIVWRNIPDLTDKDYIYYLAISSELREIAIKSMVGSSGRQRAQQSVLDEYETFMPPLPEQRAIAATLSCLDDKIELNNKTNANLEAQAQAIFKSWFVDFEPFRDGEFVESELGPIPKEWRVGTLSEIGTIVGGATPSKAKEEYYTKSGKGIAWITPKDLSVNKEKFVSHGEIDITETGYKKASTKIMPAGSVLFSSRAPIGYMAISNNELCTNQGFKSIVPNKKVGTGFVYYTLKSNMEAIQNLGSGSTFKEVSGAVMNNVRILIPSNQVIAEFDDICSLVFEKQKVLEDQSHTLADLRDTLLPKLMSGEINVPVGRSDGK